MVVACFRDANGEWDAGVSTSCQGAARVEVSRDGGTLGIPRGALAAIRAKLVQEESVDRIKAAAIETGTKSIELFLGRLPDFFKR